jgi:hypothetical protein
MGDLERADEKSTLHIGTIMDNKRKRLTPEEIKSILETVFTVPKYGSTTYTDFILNEMQAEVIKNTGRKCIILKARKEGFSTLVLAIAIIHAHSFPHYKAMFLADIEANTLSIFEKAKSLILKAKVPFNVEIGKKSIKFLDNGSEIVVSTAGRKSAGRGDDLHFVHFSELAFFEYPEIFNAVLEACHRDALVYFESTANGRNLYFDLWSKAQGYPTTSSYRPYFFPWFKHPEYALELTEPIVLTDEEKDLKSEYKLTDEQINWRRDKLTSMPDPTMFQQEYPINADEAFLSSGRPVFSVKSLQNMKQIAKPYRQGYIELNKKRELMFYDETGGDLQIYAMPESSRDYVIGADSSEGKASGDFGVLSVWDATTGEQVAQWRGKCDPDQLAVELNKLGRYYNTALINPERNNMGMTVISRLYNELEYPRIFQEPGINDAFIPETTERLGLRTTTKTRDLMIGLAKRWIREGKIKLNSIDAINEFISFIYTKSGKMEHDTGKHDDCVFAGLLAFYVLDTYPELKNTYFKSSDGKYFGLIKKINSDNSGKNVGIGGY